MAETAAGRSLKRWFTIVVVVIVLWAVVLILKPMRMPIAWAALLAFLLHPLQRRLTRRFGNENAAAGVITGLTPVAIILPLTLLGIAFVQQISQIVQSLQSSPNLWDAAAWQDPDQHPRVAQLVAWARERFDFTPEEFQQQVAGGVTTVARKLAAASGQVFLNTAGTVLRFFLMLFILFFMLRDGPKWARRAANLVPLAPSSRNALFDRLGKVTRAVVYGCGVTAAVQGMLVGIGFAIAGLPGPVVFGVMAGVSALLPFGGAALVWAPAAIWLFASGEFGWGIFMSVWGGVVSTSDNFIRPIIISRYTPVPTLLVFLGVIGGVAAFGPIGFIFGPVILVLAIELLRFAEETLARRE
jgi:predicted PurR-regulated permease PerM